MSAGINTIKPFGGFCFCRLKDSLEVDHDLSLTDLSFISIDLMGYNCRFARVCLQERIPS